MKYTLYYFLMIAPVTAFLVSKTQDKSASQGSFCVYQWMHAINSVVWYALGCANTFYRCDCKWLGAVDHTFGYLGPMAAILFAATHVAEQNWK